MWATLKSKHGSINTAQAKKTGVIKEVNIYDAATLKFLYSSFQQISKSIE